MSQKTSKPCGWYNRLVAAACFQAWTRAVHQSRRVEVTQLKVRLQSLNGSIWNKNKDELVQEAIHQLGWTEEQARGETVGQLRLHLKELKDSVRSAQPELMPKGTARM